MENPVLHTEGINTVEIAAECQTEQIADIAFVVDATGSMDDEIEFLKQEVLDIVKSASEQNPNSQINLASLFYRCEGNEYVTKHSDFSADHSKTFNFIIY